MSAAPPPTALAGGLSVLAAMALWSTGPVFLRAAALPVPTFILIGNLVGAAAIFLPSPRGIRRETAAAPRTAVLVVATAGAFNALTYYLGLSVAPIVDVMAAHYTGPILVALAAPVLVGERPGPGLWAGLALSAAGLVGILAGTGDAGGTHPRLGVALGLLSATGFCASVLAIRSLAAGGVSARVISFLMAVGLIPFCLPFASLSAVALPGAALAAAAGLLHLPIAARLFARGAAGVSAPATGIIGYSELVFGAAWGFLIYGEPLPPARLLGAALIIIGGVVAIRAEAGAAARLVPPTSG